jgi:hypothetical protein
MKRILIIALIVFILAAGICSADEYVGGLPLTTVSQGEVSGGVYFDSYYGAAGQTGGQPITINKAFALPSYTDIEWAMLLTTVYCGHMENNFPGWANVTFNGNVLGNESLNIPFTFKKDGGTGYEIVNDHVNRVSSDYMMWYDVTSFVQSTNTATVHTEKNGTSSSFDGRIKLITLVVAYNDGSGNTIYYWVNRGHDVDTYNPPDTYIGSTNFTASLPSGATVQDANLTAVHMASEDGIYTFNTNSIANSTPQGTYCGSNQWNVTSSFNLSGNNTLTYDRGGGYYKIALGILAAEYQELTTQPDLMVTAIDAYHNETGYHPYFSLSNEVDVKVENIGDGVAGPSKVSLYANDTFIGKTDVSSLNAGENTTVQFIWTPSGTDCEDGGSPISYTLKAIADCDGAVTESNESNNESTTTETAYWAGWSADEHLTAVFHDTIQGGLYYTTGNGSYYSGGLYDGQSVSTRYDDIGTSIPSEAQIELARLNVYYTWSRIGTGGNGIYPLMEVSITNSSGTYIVDSDAEYNDRPCPPIYYNCPYGNYVYDITAYIKGENTITVTVKNVGPANSNFCPAAPGIVILYSDVTKPTYEYWLVEGADIIEGGRKGGAGNLDLSECISNATFTGSVTTGSVDNATLGIVSAWGGNADNSHYWFNDNYLGDRFILGGYSSLYSKTINDITMYVGESGSAQVGANVSDVTGSIINQDNMASFGDDGDSMMAANAFLLVGYESQAGLCGDVNNDGNVNMADVMTLWYDIADYPSPEAWTISNAWAADVNCDSQINMADVMTLWYDIADYPTPGAWVINCC